MDGFFGGVSLQNINIWAVESYGFFLTKKDIVQLDTLFRIAYNSFIVHIMELGRLPLILK